MPQALTQTLTRPWARPALHARLAGLALLAALLLQAAPSFAAERSSPLRAGLERSAQGSDLYAWYAARNFTPVWTDSRGLTANGRAALRTLANVGNEGLPPARYALPGATAKTPEQRAALDIAISRALRQYINDVQYGAANPHAPAPSLAELSKAAAAKDLHRHLAAQRPHDAAYGRLRGILTAARTKADPASLARVQETILALEKMRWEHKDAGAERGTNVAWLAE